MTTHHAGDNRWRSIGLRCLLFVGVSWPLFVLWHEQFGRFMFFEIMDPPGADPHRRQHLQNAYFTIYGMLGILLGIVAAFRASFTQASCTIAVSALVWFVGRYRGLPRFFDPHSEEGYFGVWALLVVSFTILALHVAIRRALKKAPSPGQIGP